MPDTADAVGFPSLQPLLDLAIYRFILFGACIAFLFRGIDTQ
jgi:hypothetical protein